MDYWLVILYMVVMVHQWNNGMLFIYSEYMQAVG